MRTSTREFPGKRGTLKQNVRIIHPLNVGEAQTDILNTRDFINA